MHLTHIFIWVLILLVPAKITCQNLIADYPFNGNANDTSGNNHHASITQATLTTDRFNIPNSAYYFDGTDDFIEIPHHNDFNFAGNQEFTISVWINAPFNQLETIKEHNDIISKWANTLNENLDFIPYPYTIRIGNSFDPQIKGQICTAVFDSYNSGCGNQSKLYSGQLLNDNQWHNIIFLRNTAGLLEQYIDCNLTGQAMDSTVCDLTNSSPLRIGKRGGNIVNPLPEFYFTGKIDDIKIFDYALPYDSLEKICLTTTLSSDIQDFAVESNKSGNLLQWETSQEINIDHYEIYHGTNPQNLSFIGKVLPNVQDDYPKFYSYFHTNPEAGENYYQLKIVDLNGEIRFSDMISIMNRSAANVIIKPSPADAYIVIETDIALSDVQIVNTIGQLIKTYKKIEVGEEIDITNLDSGHYFLIYECKGMLQSIPFNVSH